MMIVNQRNVNQSKLFFICVLSIIICLSLSSYVVAEVEITASVDEKYDDNITYSSSNEKDDFITSAAIGGKYIYESKSQLLNFNGTIQQDFYVNNSDFNNNSQRANVNYTLACSKFLRVQAFEQFSHAEEPRSFEDEFGRTSGRYSYIRNVMGVTGVADVNKKVQVALAYTNEIHELSDNAGADSIMNKAKLSGTYFLSSANQITGFYEFAHRVYDPGGDITRNSFVGAGRHYFDPNWYLDGGIGLDLLDAKTSEMKPQWFVTLTHDLSEVTYLSLKYEQQYITQAYSEELFQRWQTSLSAGCELTQRMRGTASVFYGRGEYDVSKTEDSFIGANLGMSYEIAKNIKGVVSYAVRNVASNRNTREYLKNTFSIGVSITFD